MELYAHARLPLAWPGPKQAVAQYRSQVPGLEGPWFMASASPDLYGQIHLERESEKYLPDNRTETGNMKKRQHKQGPDLTPYVNCATVALNGNIK